MCDFSRTDEEIIVGYVIYKEVYSASLRLLPLFIVLQQ